MFIIAKDKLIGALIMCIGILIAIIYTMGSVVDLYLETVLDQVGGLDLTSGIFGMDLLNWKLFVVAPLWLIVILIAVIAIWIGYSMLTVSGDSPYADLTPAPVPLEELEEELAAEEAAA